VPAFSATARGFRSDSCRHGWRSLDAAEWVVESLNSRCGLISRGTMTACCALESRVGDLLRLRGRHEEGKGGDYDAFFFGV
jgi:hypothetical protein